MKGAAEILIMCRLGVLGKMVTSEKDKGSLMWINKSWLAIQEEVKKEAVAVSC